MEISTAFVGILDFFAQTGNAIDIGEYGVGILDSIERLLPKHHDMVAVAISKQTRGGLDLACKVVLKVGGVGIGLSVDADVGEEIVGGNGTIVGIAGGEHIAEMTIAYGHGGLETRLGIVGGAWLIERQRVLRQIVVVAACHHRCSNCCKKSACNILDTFHKFYC